MRREEKKREREGETWVRWCDRREVREKREERRDLGRRETREREREREREKEINKKMIELYYSAQYCKNFGIYDF